MRFRKLGLIVGPDQAHPWSQTYALAPTPILRDDRLRVYFATCDAQMVGRIAYVDLDASDPTRVISRSGIILDAGEPGCFDDNGANVTSLVQVGSELWCYYFGYQLHQKTRYSLFAGLAISRDGGETFKRASETPLLDRSDSERFVRSAPFVLRDGNRFKMWYVGGNEWITVHGKPLPRYNLFYAESHDGRIWPRTGREVLSLSGDDEHGFGRPYVVPTSSGYRLWYSLRTKSQGYRIGLAHSEDGLTWTRRDGEVGLDVSPAGWDSEIVCYAAEITARGTTYLFYNGNGYGRAGFGVAVRV